MGSSLAELDQRDVARVRVELAEVIAAHFAYPTFFDYHASTSRMRPLSAARRHEIAQFAQMADLGSIERTDLTSPQVRRFLERLLQRYLDLNADLTRAPARQQLALMRVEVPRVAAEIQRGLVSFAAGASDAPGGYGVARQRMSWSGTDGDRVVIDPAAAERSATLIQAALLPRRDASSAPAPPPAPTVAPSAFEELAATSTAPRPIMSAAPEPDTSTFWGGYPAPLNDHTGNGFATSQEQTAPQPVVNGVQSPAYDEPEAALEPPAIHAPAPFNGNGNGHAASVAPAGWAALLHDLSGPMPALPAERPPAVPSSPFLGLEGGAQSGLFGALPANPFSAPLTEPLSANGNGHRLGAGGGDSDDSDDADSGARGLPPGLVEMYSAYLRALRPGSAPTDAAPPMLGGAMPAPVHGAGPRAAMPPERDERDVWARSTMPPAPKGSIAPLPVDAVSPATEPPREPPPARSTPMPAAGAGSDRMIFAQLRNQLDAYLLATAQAAGIPATSGDPERMLAALRRNGRMSAADVRLAENILAITGRVLAGGEATPDDYRQAFMLYLLYHRGRVGT